MEEVKWYAGLGIDESLPWDALFVDSAEMEASHRAWKVVELYLVVGTGFAVGIGPGSETPVPVALEEGLGIRESKHMLRVPVFALLALL